MLHTLKYNNLHFDLLTIYINYVFIYKFIICNDNLTILLNKF